MDLRRIEFKGYTLNTDITGTSESLAYFDKDGQDDGDYIQVFWPDETILDNGNNLPLLIVQKVEECETVKTVVVNMYRFTDEFDDYKFIGDYLLEILGEKK